MNNSTDLRSEVNGNAQDELFGLPADVLAERDRIVRLTVERRQARALRLRRRAVS